MKEKKRKQVFYYLVKMTIVTNISNLIVEKKILA